MVVGPGVQFKAVERNALPPDRDVSHERPDFGVESVAVHAQIERGIAQTDQSREQERARRDKGFRLKVRHFAGFRQRPSRVCSSADLL